MKYDGFKKLLFLEEARKPIAYLNESTVPVQC